MSSDSLTSGPLSFDIDVTCRRGDRTIALRFRSASGVTAIIGPSGAGKTTILDMIAGLVQPVEGHIAVAGQMLFNRDANVDLPPEKRACGYVFQDLRLFPHLRVRDNLLYGQRRKNFGQSLMTLPETLEFLGIESLVDRMPRTLSGGEAQRVAIGRALLSGPKFLLLDEPLSSVDPARRDEIMTVIERVRDELSLPVLYVSHDRAEVDRLAGSVIPMG